LIKQAEPLESALSAAVERLSLGMDEMYAKKLGLLAFQREPVASDSALESDHELLARLFQLLRAREIDMTLFFRQLSSVDCEREPGLTDAELSAPLARAYYAPCEGDAQIELAAFLRRYAARVRLDGVPAAERKARMDAVNPKYVPRNYLAQLAIEQAEQGEGAALYELLDVLRRPYDEQPEHDKYAEKRPEWARQRAGCSMLSCSS
jgi:uncharacterized protein YdiU (UPF0061 family)